MNSIFNRSMTFDNMLDNFFDNFFCVKKEYRSTVKDNKEKNSVLTIEVPGFTKEDLKITFDDDSRILSIKGESKNPHYENKINRWWTLSKNVKIKEVKLENGLLVIHLEDQNPPKKDLQRIEIK